jgi:hypothetical protein
MLLICRELSTLHALTFEVRIASIYNYIPMFLIFFLNYRIYYIYRLIELLLIRFMISKYKYNCTIGVLASIYKQIYTKNCE